jgi:hypothetical protein
MAEEDEDTGLKPRKTTLEDAFMQHPHSGALIRNPLKEKAKSQPILLSISEFNHNCLDDSLGEWHCVSVNESGFRDLMSHYADTHGSNMPSSWSRTVAVQSRCTVGRVHALNGGFDFVVQLRKSTYVAPRKKLPRPGDRKDHPGVMIDKLNLEVSDIDGTSLRVENVVEGLVLAWNRAHPSFPVKIGDVITKVNDKKRNTSAMIEELQHCPEVCRLWVHRAPVAASRVPSKDPYMSLAAEGTMLPGSEMPAGSLANPQKRQSSKPGAH